MTAERPREVSTSTRSIKATGTIDWRRFNRPYWRTDWEHEGHFVVTWSADRGQSVIQRHSL